MTSKAEDETLETHEPSITITRPSNQVLCLSSYILYENLHITVATAYSITTTNSPPPQFFSPPQLCHLTAATTITIVRSHTGKTDDTTITFSFIKINYHDIYYDLWGEECKR